MLHTAEVGRNGVVVRPLERASSTRQGFVVLHVALVLVVMGLGLDTFFRILGSSPALLAPGLVAKVPLTPAKLLMIVGGIHIGLAALTGAKPRVGGLLLAIWLLAFAINLVLAHEYLFALVTFQAFAAAFAVSRIQTAYERTTDLD